MKTFVAKPSDIKREWVVIDASGQTLGRLATSVAVLLRGKHKAIFSPNIDVGDHVVVVNAAKIVVTGNKLKEKVYYHHTQYAGGLKAVGLEDMMKKHPTRAIEHAVKGMLPHNRLGEQMFKKLKVYAGPEHKHQAQVAAAVGKES